MKPQMMVACEKCKALAHVVAHDSGDGWATGYECDHCGEQGEIDSDQWWPFRTMSASARDWRAIGVEVV